MSALAIENVEKVLSNGFYTSEDERLISAINTLSQNTEHVNFKSVYQAICSNVRMSIGIDNVVGLGTATIEGKQVAIINSFPVLATDGAFYPMYTDELTQETYIEV